MRYSAIMQNDNDYFHGKVLIAGVTNFEKMHGEPIFRPKGLEKWILNITLSGKGWVFTGKPRFHVEKGDVLLFPPHVVHHYGIYPKQNWLHFWVYFAPRTNLIPLLDWPEANQGVLKINIQSQSELDMIIEESQHLLKRYNSPSIHRLDFCHNHLERILLLCAPFNPQTSRQRDGRVEKAISHIKKHFNEDIKVSHLAAKCGMSESRFAHLFSEQTGISPMRFLEKLRIEEVSRILLSSNLSIAEAAEKAGYKDPYYFSNVFKKVTGKRPSEYRNSF